MGLSSMGVEIDQLPRIGMKFQLIDHEQGALLVEEVQERTAEAPEEPERLIAEGQGKQVEKTAIRADLRITGDRAAGCVPSDSHHCIYVPGSAHSVAGGLILDVDFITLLCMGR